MARERSILLVKPRPIDGEETGMGFFGSGEETSSPPDLIEMGTLREVIAQLAGFNTAPDGSAESGGILYGPGLTVEVPLIEQDAQVMRLGVSITEEDTAWPVLVRMPSA